MKAVFSLPRTVRFLELLIAGALCVASFSCRSSYYERMIKKSRPVKPEWTRKTPPPSEKLDYFVGRSVAVNTLDERNAVNKALEDARRKIAGVIGVRVKGASTWRKADTGHWVRGEDRVNTTRNTHYRQIIDSIVQGARIVDMYYEVWEIGQDRPDRIPHEFRRYKYWVLVSFPSDKLSHCRKVAEEKLRNTRSALLQRAMKAQAGGDYEKAIELNERVSLEYPWASDSGKAGVARACRKWAAEKAEAGDFQGALECLQRGFSSSLPDDLARKMKRDYERIYSRWAGRRISSMVASRGWDSVGAVSSDAEASGGSADSDLSVGVANALCDTGRISPRICYLSEAGQEALSKGGSSRLPGSDLKELSEGGDTAFFVTKRGRQLSTSLYIPEEGKTVPVLSVENLGAGQGEADSREPAPWEGLLSGDWARGNFGLEVWTDRDTYGIGSSLRVSVRATRQCFVTMVNVDSAGNVKPFLPRFHAKRNLVMPGRTYSAPNSDGLGFFKVDGPPGTEKFKVIASATPLNLPVDSTLQLFFSALGDCLETMDPASLGFAECSFKVVDST